MCTASLHTNGVATQIVSNYNNENKNYDAKKNEYNDAEYNH